MRSSVVASVIVCTVVRRELANACVASIAAQQGLEPENFEIIIVDNSGPGYFEEDAAAWVRRAACSVVYIHEPVRNIACARNAGFRAAQGAFVAFIDDDERADPDWLFQLLRAAEEWQADAVYGPVFPEFEGGAPPPWDSTGLRFQYSHRLEPGAHLEVAATGNLLVRRSSCLEGSEPFDPAYGQTGGEDTAFTYNLTRHGRKIVWCPEAVIHEFVPRSRLTVEYNLMRLLIGTQIFIRVQLKHEPVLRAAIRGGWLTFKGLGLALVSLPAMIASFCTSESRVYQLRAPFFRGLGTMFWPLRLRRYRDR